VVGVDATGVGVGSTFVTGMVADGVSAEPPPPPQAVRDDVMAADRSMTPMMGREMCMGSR
jgi:hypothetical protein